MASSILVMSIVLAFLFGFASQKCGLCAVSAVRHLVAERTAGPFASFFCCSAWVTVVSVPLWWFLPGARIPEVHSLSVGALLGAALFGAGAAINGGCNFGTLTRFATGDMSFALTVVGGAAGVSAKPLFADSGSAVTAGSTPMAGNADLAVIAFLIAIAIGIAGLPLRTGRPGAMLWDRLGPALLGLTGGLLYVLHGGWAYTLAITRLAGPPQPADISRGLLLLITIATLGGALAAAFHSGDFDVRFPLRDVPNRLAGGFAMGFGASLVPGGNGVLILQGIPALSPHALPAYALLCMAIAAMLLVSPHLRALAHLPFSPSPERNAEN